MSPGNDRFSSRLEWNLRPNRIAMLLREKAADTEVLDLTQSNPTKAGFAPRSEDVQPALADPASLVYRPDVKGLRSAREAVAEYHRGSAEAARKLKLAPHGGVLRGVESRAEKRGLGREAGKNASSQARRLAPQELATAVDAEQIVLTASTSEAYSFIFKLLGDPGDEVLVPQPSYPLFDFLAGLESLQVRHYPLVWDGIWRVDLEGIVERLGDRTKVIVVVNPNNPTGSYLKRAEVDRLLSVCAERRIALISDEVFFDFAMDPWAERVSVASHSQRALTFTLSGLSKVAGLPQMKLGWIVVSGPDDVRTRALEGLELIADTYLSVGAPVQHGAARLLVLRAGYQEKVTERTVANLTDLRKATADGLCAPLHVEGGWYATVRLPPGIDEEDLVLDLLREDDVLVQPGYFYDFPFPCLVLSLLTQVEVFEEGVGRLSGRCSSHTRVDI